MLKVLVIHPEDNVAVALEAIPALACATVLGGSAMDQIHARTAIPFAHKIAVRPILARQPILKYGVPIAFATADIEPGDWVHTHNATSYFSARREGQNP
jgi:hypothetical protein